MTEPISLLEERLKRMAAAPETASEHLKNGLQSCEALRRLAHEIPDPSTVAALVLYVASIENRIGRALAQIEQEKP